MDIKNSKSLIPDKSKAAVCGLFCASCGLYIGTVEDPRRLATIAHALGQSVEDTRCEGCRSQVRTSYCKTCKMYTCAEKRGLDFCGQCPDYPCEEIKQFQSILPHRLELWQSQDRIKEVGWEQWYKEECAYYACPRCGTLNSAYDKACRKCGATPSCEYVRVNREDIDRRMPKRD
jgi:hypothetical protein